MSSKFRSFLKKFVPSSAKTNKHYADTVLSELKSLQARLDEQSENDKCILEKLDRIDEEARALGEETSAGNARLVSQMLNQKDELYQSITEQIRTNTDALREKLDEQHSTAKENCIKLGEQITESEKELETLLDKKFKDADSALNALGEKANNQGKEIGARLDSGFKSIAENTAELSTKTKQQSSKLENKLDLLNNATEELKVSLSDSDKKLNSRFDALDNSQKALSNQVSDENAKLARQLELLKQQAKAIDTLMSERFDSIEKSFGELNELSTSILESTAKIKDDIEASATRSDKIEKGLTASTDEILKLQAELEQKALEKLDAVYQKTQDAVRNSAETVYAHVFNNVITKAGWLKDKNFAPGRWAVGYPYLYVMFQTLNTTKPKCILDLGLGQTTKMLTQYAAANDDVEHIVLENDPDWIKVFKSRNRVSERTKIVLSDLEFIKYKSDDSVRVYSSFKEAVKGKKFDFISIDGPLGGDMKKYSRIDILSVIPECLADDFVIMMHDMERQMEMNTLVELQFLLQQASIKYRRGRYNGQKDTILICSEQPGYLTSL